MNITDMNIFKIISHPSLIKTLSKFYIKITKFNTFLKYAVIPAKLSLSVFLQCVLRHFSMSLENY